MLFFYSETTHSKDGNSVGMAGVEIFKIR